jgi:hypothetical protein
MSRSWKRASGLEIYPVENEGRMSKSNWRNRLSRIGLCLLACVLFAGQLLAQSAGTGALTGTVTDTGGGIVAGATVTLTSTETNQTRTVTTGSDGVYKCSLLPPGTYRVTFAATGFKTAEVSAVTVNVTENLS